MNIFTWKIKQTLQLYKSYNIICRKYCYGKFLSNRYISWFVKFFIRNYFNIGLGSRLAMPMFIFLWSYYREQEIFVVIILLDVKLCC